MSTKSQFQKLHPRLNSRVPQQISTFFIVGRWELKWKLSTNHVIYVPCDTTFLREVYILSDEFFFSGLVWWSVPLEQFTISWTLVILTNFNPWAARLPPSVKINVYDRKSLCQAPPKIDQSPKTCIEKHVLIGLKGINTVPKRLNSLNFILNFFFEKIIIFSIFKVYLALQRESSRPEKMSELRTEVFRSE